MADNHIQFRIGSTFEGEGFKKAQAALAENRKEIASSVRGLGELTNALGGISPATETAVSSVRSLGAAFLSGGIVGGTIQLAIQGISFAVEKGVELFKSFEERTRRLAETMRDDFLAAIGSSEARFKSLSAEMAKANQQARDLAAVLNGQVAQDVQMKVYQLHMDKLQAVTDNMTEGGKAVVEAQFAMREATLKAQAAVETSYNNLELANAEVVNAGKVLAEAERRVAESDIVLNDARQNEAGNAEYLARVQAENAEAHKALEDATYAVEKARRNAATASDRVTLAEKALEVTTKEHNAKILEANRKIDEEIVKKNELALKEEEAAAKWKEYLSTAFDREMNARNELALKEEEARFALQNYTENLKEQYGLVNNQSADEFLQELEDILNGKKSKKDDARGMPVRVTNPGDIASSFSVNVNGGEGGGGGGGNGPLNFGQQKRANGAAARQNRNAMNQLNGQFGQDFQRMIGEITGVRQGQRDSDEFMGNMVSRELPSLVNTYGTERVSEAISNAASRMLLPSDFAEVFGDIGSVQQMLDATLRNNNPEGQEESQVVGELSKINQKLDRLGLQ